MPTFRGIDHLSLSVVELDRSEAFYTEVLDFVPIADFGETRTFLHREQSFLLALTQHPEGSGRPFSELHTGVDHVGLVAESREELVAWSERFDAAGVTYTPIRDMPLGHHLNFRDPDQIPWELYVPGPFIVEGYAELREREIPPEEIAARMQEYLESLP